jgi:methyl-accepting chemotaxis protein
MATDGSVKIDELIGEVVRGARQTEEDSAAASSTATMVGMNVRMVSGMMGEMVRSIAEVLNRASQSQKVAERAIAASARTTKLIAQLTAAVERIASTSKVIDRISEQTNILSLNATIEAARAGEAGRGFAVVANEVKALTRQTGEATRNINEELHALRTANAELGASLAGTSTDFGAIQTAVDGVMTSVHECEASLKAVTEFAHEAADSVEQVASILDRTAGAAHAIADKFSHLQVPCNNSNPT